MENEVNDISVVASKSRLLKYYEKYMMAMGILGQGIFFMQGIKIFQTRSADDVSFGGFLFGLISVISWMIYGRLIKDKVLFAVNIIATFGALFVIIGILLYSS